MEGGSTAEESSGSGNAKRSMAHRRAPPTEWNRVVLVVILGQSLDVVWSTPLVPYRGLQ